ncbi:FmdB family zinc ribbon protein [Nakamurella multipartita]|uniref:Regulatory protein, FmdB family n=1 Tax=Nakamurella multipartita (strain ATCC 700099 / DSM 44233 / CIP 104796 / JCM 9543 / NBRC 105858 / Y-104) TaxID=479431 RepID=C8X7R9_NAKMY|nr:FmdB family zinc ribbon protein [Nakamurella multipartita]ACV80922.1 regulatory protein, FmdB family [Nakamurella multipartita DSM 44233]HOZ60228.1 zinc ribbon domain-containing protein [Nakamurella multipartita]
MPTYQYACTECGHRFEAVQAFTDDSLTTCPVCSGQLRKVYGSVGVVFKGSGFYRTDSRNGKTATAPPASGDKADKPAAAKADKPAAKSDSSSGGSSDSGSSSKPAASTSSSSSTAKAAS